MTLIASSFLAGSILSLLIPVLLLIALVIWYVKFLRRVPETGREEVAAKAASGNPGPAAAPASAPNPSPAGGPGGAASPGTSHAPGER